MTAAQAQKTRLITPGRVQALSRRVTLESEVVVGSSGAITSQTAQKDSGMFIELTAGKSGRYTVYVFNGWKRLTKFGAVLIGPDDSAVTDGSGIIPVFRNNDIGEGADDGTIELQWIKNTDASDAHVTSGNKFKVWLELEDFPSA